MALERFPEYTKNLTTAVVLGAGILTAGTVFNPELSADVHIGIHQIISDDFNTQYASLAPEDRLVYRQSVVDDLASKKNIFGGLSVACFAITALGAHEARRNRSARQNIPHF